jgi:hypothetical protein
MAETIRQRRQRQQKKTLYEMGYKYLCDNFHKFNEQQKIKIALEAYRLEKTRPLVDQSKHTHITYVFDDQKNSDPVHAAGLSSGDTRLGQEI